ncbi:MAG: hypothetical protein OHK005_21230 [Candidatus Methylacidiphilales bacterium]
MDGFVRHELGLTPFPACDCLRASMDIAQHGTGDSRTLVLAGRLDSRWADHVASAITAALHDGVHSIDLDLTQVSFVSSAGLQALLKAHKQLAAARGHLRISAASAEAKTVLELSGLESLLAPVAESSPQGAPPGFESTSAVWAVSSIPGRELSARRWGQPGLPGQSTRQIALGANSCAIGWGSAGSSAPGEFLHAGSTFFFLPPDGGGSPDFIQTPPDRTTNIQSPCGGCLEGKPPRTFRFSKKAESGSVPWTEIVETVGAQLRADRFGLTAFAETSAVVGAALTTPPERLGPDWLEFPGIRDTLSFTTEPAFTRNLALMVAWVERSTPTRLTHEFLRPLAPGSSWWIHAHAVIFPYRPLPKDLTEPAPFLTDLLEEDSPEAILHLLTDPRDDGVGETRLNRGVVWAGAFGDIKGGEA